MLNPGRCIAIMTVFRTSQPEKPSRSPEVTTDMATRNNNPSGATDSQALKDVMAKYTSAIKLLHQGQYQNAKDLFSETRGALADEPELTDRAAAYVRICENRLLEDPGVPEGDEIYRRAVFLSNSGDLDGAIQLMNRALAENPASIDCLYVRASAWALKGAAEKSVGDLRQAIALEPKIRFQAVNDSDFEKIREEPAFIDIIEPTPTGA